MTVKAIERRITNMTFEIRLDDIPDLSGKVAIITGLLLVRTCWRAIADTADKVDLQASA